MKPKIEIGRREITGHIISTKWRHTSYGAKFSILVEDQDGNRYFGTNPSGCYAEISKVITFKAMVHKNPNADHFAFFSYPRFIKSETPAPEPEPTPVAHSSRQTSTVSAHTANISVGERYHGKDDANWWGVTAAPEVAVSPDQVLRDRKALWG